MKDREAFLRNAMETYGGAVYRLALCRLQNAADAEDVYQDVFLRLLGEEARDWDGEYLKAWLLRAEPLRGHSSVPPAADGAVPGRGAGAGPPRRRRGGGALGGGVPPAGGGADGGAPALRGRVPHRGDRRHAACPRSYGAHPAPPGENETEGFVRRYER